MVDLPLSIFSPKTKSTFFIFFIERSLTSISKLFAKPIAELVGIPFMKAVSALGPFRSSILSLPISVKPDISSTIRLGVEEQKISSLLIKFFFSSNSTSD